MDADRIYDIEKYVRREVEAPANQRLFQELIDEVKRLQAKLPCGHPAICSGEDGCEWCDEIRCEEALAKRHGELASEWNEAVLYAGSEGFLNATGEPPNIKRDCMEVMVGHVRRLQAELDRLKQPPDVEAWKAVVKYAYADGGDGATLIQQITTHYNAMRTDRDDIKLFVEFKHGPSGEVLRLLADGCISVGKAAEALAEIAQGLIPQLPANWSSALGDGEVAGEVITALRGEVRSLKNICGDNLCWITDTEAAKALPEAEFLESCRRYRNQIAIERGEFAGGMTIAQLEAEVAEWQVSYQRLAGAARGFLVVVSEAEVPLNGCIGLAFVHGFPYVGPNWNDAKRVLVGELQSRDLQVDRPDANSLRTQHGAPEDVPSDVAVAGVEIDASSVDDAQQPVESDRILIGSNSERPTPSATRTNAKSSTATGQDCERQHGQTTFPAFTPLHRNVLLTLLCRQPNAPDGFEGTDVEWAGAVKELVGMLRMKR